MSATHRPRPVLIRWPRPRHHLPQLVGESAAHQLIVDAKAFRQKRLANALDVIELPGGRKRKGPLDHRWAKLHRGSVLQIGVGPMPIPAGPKGIGPHR